MEEICRDCVNKKGCNMKPTSDHGCAGYSNNISGRLEELEAENAKLKEKLYEKVCDNCDMTNYMHGTGIRCKDWEAEGMCEWENILKSLE